MGDEQLSTGEHWEEIVPPISQDMGRKAVDEPKKRNRGPFRVFAKKGDSRSFLLYRWPLGFEKGVEVMYNIKSPRLSSGSACENLSSLRAKVPWSWSFQLHRYTHTQTHWRDVKTRSVRLLPATEQWQPRIDYWRPHCSPLMWNGAQTPWRCWRIQTGWTGGLSWSPCSRGC
jgi:hypothetical protein